MKQVQSTVAVSLCRRPADERCGALLALPLCRRTLGSPLIATLSRTAGAAMRIATFVIVLSLLVTSLNTTARAAASEPIEVQLASGRTFTAQVDVRTDETTLWLRFQTASTLLLRPVAWDQVVSATVAGRTLDAQQLQAAAADLKSPPAEMKWPEEIAAPAPTGMAEQAQFALSAAPRLQDLGLDAQLGNWDLDVETDGLRVRLLPLDGQGTLIPVGATVDIQLLAPLRRRFQDAPHARGQSLEIIGNWTRFLQPSDFGPQGAELLLPFQATHPEEDDRVGAFGVVNVRLAVPGHGVVERRLEMVRVRPFTQFPQ
jgi:hypothetical protein